MLVCPVAIAQPRATTQPDAVTTLIEGQVFDPSGAGVEGARVVAARPGQGSAEPVELAAASTDEMGDFVLTMPGRVAGKVLVSITKDGFAPASREVDVDPDDEFPPFVDLELAGTIVVSGTVQDAHRDQPLAGATVAIQSVFKTWAERSDAQGKFSVSGLTPGAVNSAVMTVKADGFGWETLALRDSSAHQAPGGDGLLVKLKPERIVHLRVQEEGGKPIAAVSVECLDEARDDFRSLVTDGSGELTIRGLHYDTARLAVRLTHDAHVSSTEFDRELELPADPLESTHTLVMEPAGAVAGTITDRVTGRTLNGARVAVGAFAGARTPRSWSDFDGKYRIDGVTPGRQVVTVHLAGHGPELGEVDVVAGQTSTLNVQLGSGSQVGGEVVDAQGQPVAGAYVVAGKWRGHQSLGLQAITDAQGRFAISDAPTDEFRVAVTHPQYRACENLSVQAPKTDYRFELSAMPSRPTTSVTVGQDAPAFKVITLDGRTITSAELKGKTVLLDFWATWCVPCMMEMPNVQAVHEAFGKREDFVMIGISSDDNEQTLRRFIKEHKIGWSQVFGPTSGGRQAAEDFGVYGIPAAFLIGPDGKIRGVDLRGADLKTEVQKLLGTSATP